MRARAVVFWLVLATLLADLLLTLAQMLAPRAAWWIQLAAPPPTRIDHVIAVVTPR
ncbi:MAG: hypothetical protein HYU55_09240 [Nocardioides sp.]|nr:hypothetical protein [Nocardioides sp.]